MQKINEILNDNSLNDKLLIKELSDYIKNHKLKNKKINKKFVSDVVGIIASNEEGIVNNLACLDEPTFLGSYYNKNIIINLTRLNNMKYYFPNQNMEIMSYYTVLQTIIHEMTHAKQYYVCENDKNKLYASSFEYVQDYYENYLINHDTVPTERYADARGAYIAYKVLSYIYPEEKLTYIKKLFLSEILKGYGYRAYCYYDYEYDCYVCDPENDYKFESPIEQFNEIISQTGIDRVEIDENDTTNLFERIYLGLDITEEEYMLFSASMDDLAEGKNQGKKLSKRRMK